MFAPNPESRKTETRRNAANREGGREVSVRTVCVRRAARPARGSGWRRSTREGAGARKEEVAIKCRRWWWWRAGGGKGREEGSAQCTAPAGVGGCGGGEDTHGPSRWSPIFVAFAGVIGGKKKITGEGSLYWDHSTSQIWMCLSTELKAIGSHFKSCRISF